MLVNHHQLSQPFCFGTSFSQPFVHTDDIANAAFEALATDKYSRQDVFVAGPELLNHDQVAAIFTKVLGREIVHKRLPDEEYENIFSSFGSPSEFIAERLKAEKRVSEGEEEKIFNDSSEGKKHRGKVTLEQYIRENENLWK
ncbi:hypothetical protein BJ165DRAFT_283006 [Panaeolus papilionaceus]|nr:hypothetical protein BJ165DRAFT_283006 [Panaeolus papilionaceus]